jgi:ADP-dependent NAD(P)H-hydrate dehydratase / NAD(P)H-hydrate epimerase
VKGAGFLLSFISACIADIRKIDQDALRDYGISPILLMENAGRSVCDVIARKFQPCNILVLAGKGNNGGDGFVAARHLSNRGYRVRVALLEDASKLKAEPLKNYSILSHMGIPCFRIDEGSENEFLDRLREAELVIDAILGIGTRGAVEGTVAKVIHAINASKRPVVSVDIPSGLDADSGQVHGAAVRATLTVTLALPKKGLFLGEGPQCSGEIEIADIGVPEKLLAPFRN